ncbi:MAG: hypothetical protein JWP00_4470 [Chloroflexi bacterium]|nr:hypothetical protein [Chloroflexota bacterium]
MGNCARRGLKFKSTPDFFSYVQYFNLVGTLKSSIRSR